MIKLKEFWKWRDPDHKFVDVFAQVDKMLMKDVRTLVFKFYPENLLRKIYEHINTTLGSNFTNQQLSMVLQTQI